MVARSKKEAYDVLTSQGLYYLLPIESTRADFFLMSLLDQECKTLIHKIIQVLHCKDVKIRVVPLVKGFHVNDIINFAKAKFPIETYFAESKSGYIIPPRSFIWNLSKKD